MEQGGADLDVFDPNTLDLRTPLFRMYAGTLAEVACFVDEQDYYHFTKWMWLPKVSKGKIYFRRVIGRGGETLYLHTEILKRAGHEQPSSGHCIGDHLNGHSLDNRRQNLRWATKRENNQNRFGSAALQRELL